LKVALKTIKKQIKDSLQELSMSYILLGVTVDGLLQEKISDPV
jgi:hypothetical protein